ncbi:SOS response-associated peptidase [Candidatus Accumulibacter aalborgensis]|nr:SOS response-associated peptidase [Candidatus Accumulibacter aalborgensis]
MCGRYALYGPASRIREQFDLDGEFDFTPRHNIAPTTPALIVCPGSDGSRVGLLCRWGLIPRWARDVNTGTTLINARGETVAEKPAFRTAFRRGRCLVPANGFYEWKAVQEGGRLIKQPYYVRAPDERNLFAFAGLSERWVSAAGDEIHSCCIITTAANALMAPIHDRMPVIVGANDYAAWLDPSNTDADGLRALLRPAESGDMIAYPVSRAVNSSRSDSPTFVQPAWTRTCGPGS